MAKGRKGNKNGGSASTAVGISSDYDERHRFFQAEINDTVRENTVALILENMGLSHPNGAYDEYCRVDFSLLTDKDREYIKKRSGRG